LVTAGRAADSVAAMEVAFFFGPGSRYSYLASTQVAALAAITGAVFDWLPVLSSDLVARTGGVHRTPQEPAYRTTDIRRWARHYGVPFHDVADDVDWREWALACVVAQRLGSAAAFATRLYEAAYALGRPPLTINALVGVAETAGLNAEDFREMLADARTAAVYASNLERALHAGAFGVPSFVTPDGALFWGQDRLPLLLDHLLGQVRA
jgi:2-hydroxychromene-2-carboxylate isomerase